MVAAHHVIEKEDAWIKQMITKMKQLVLLDTIIGFKFSEMFCNLTSRYNPFFQWVSASSQNNKKHQDFDKRFGWWFDGNDSILPLPYDYYCYYHDHPSHTMFAPAGINQSVVAIHLLDSLLTNGMGWFCIILWITAFHW